MAAKQMMFETEARAEIAAGLSQLARAVKATLGPRGKNVVLQKSFGSPRVTKLDPTTHGCTEEKATLQTELTAPT